VILAQTCLLTSTRFKFYKALVRVEVLLSELESAAQDGVRGALLEGRRSSVPDLLKGHAEELYNVSALSLISEECTPAEFAQVLDLIDRFSMASTSELWKDVSGEALTRSTGKLIHTRLQELRSEWLHHYWQWRRAGLAAKEDQARRSSEQTNSLSGTKLESVMKDFRPRSSRLLRYLTLAQTWLLASTRFKLYKALVRAELLLLQLESAAQVDVRGALMEGRRSAVPDLLKGYAENLYNVSANGMISEEYSPAEFSQVLKLIDRFSMESAFELWKEVSGEALTRSTASLIHAGLQELRSKWLRYYWQWRRDGLAATKDQPFGSSEQAKSLSGTIVESMMTDFPKGTVRRIGPHAATANSRLLNIGDRARRSQIVKTYKSNNPEASNKQIIADAEIDETDFYRWQRGAHVSDHVIGRLAHVFTLPVPDIIAR
jgi:hypothetical protein